MRKKGSEREKGSERSFVVQWTMRGMFSFHRKSCDITKVGAWPFYSSSPFSSSSSSWSSAPSSPFSTFVRRRKTSEQRGVELMAAVYPNPDLTAEERNALRGLRKRKADLINEIEQIKGELQNVESELESLYYVDDSSAEKARMMVTGRKRFNLDADDGLSYMFEHHLLEQTPAAVARFLYEGDSLSKKSIGDFLGGNDQFNLDVLDRFISLQDISGLFVVDALRLILSTFQLPGEGQKIDRIMQKFGEHFCESNPGGKETPGGMHFLAYSCIMLNTLLHNPSVKDRDKPSITQYNSMVREMMEKGEVTQETVANIYDAILKTPFQLPEVTEEERKLEELFSSATRRGWLLKQGSSQSFVGPLSWRRRWFVLSEGCLYYFETPDDRVMKGIIPLKNVGVRRVEPSNRPHMFEIYSLRPEEKIVARKMEQGSRSSSDIRHSIYRLCASSQEDLRDWIDAISSSAVIDTTSSTAGLLHRPRSTH